MKFEAALMAMLAFLAFHFVVEMVALAVRVI